MSHSSLPSPSSGRAPLRISSLDRLARSFPQALLAVVLVVAGGCVTGEVGLGDGAVQAPVDTGGAADVTTSPDVLADAALAAPDAAAADTAPTVDTQAAPPDTSAPDTAPVVDTKPLGARIRSDKRRRPRAHSPA